MVESQPSKLLVAGSIPVSRSILSNNLQAKNHFHAVTITALLLLVLC